MFSWIARLIKKLLRLFGFGGPVKTPSSGRGISIGDAPTITAPPVSTIPESLRNAVKVALTGQKPTTAEINFGVPRAADLDPQRALADIRLLKAFIENHPSKAQELLSGATDLRRAQEILREAGFEGEYQRGNLVTGAITLARIYSVGQKQRQLQTGETAPSRGARTYFPLVPVDPIRDRNDAMFVGMEGGRTASVLFNVETLVETREELTVCLADAEILETAMVEHTGQFAQLYQNFQNDERVKALVYELGLDEESVLRRKGGFGCLLLMLIIVVVLVVCVAIVYSDRAAKRKFTVVDRRAVLGRLTALPITTWSYGSTSDTARHIGPMAQDFYAAFEVGDDDRYISTVDASGVALAAIQGLNELLLERNAEVSELKARLSEVERIIGTRSTTA